MTRLINFDWHDIAFVEESAWGSAEFFPPIFHMVPRGRVHREIPTNYLLLHNSLSFHLARALPLRIFPQCSYRQLR
jgi:hypothetical protein